jgi:hypothetical protein
VNNSNATPKNALSNQYPAENIWSGIVVGIRPAGLCEESSVHAERLAGDERSMMAKEECDGVGHIVRRADAA